MEHISIEYDKFGRMKFNPEFHSKMRTPWSQRDLQYLKDWYYKVGPEEMSFALERTISAVMQKVQELKRRGEINQIYDRRYTKRMRNTPSAKGASN